MFDEDKKPCNDFPFPKERKTNADSPKMKYYAERFFKPGWIVLN